MKFTQTQKLIFALVIFAVSGFIIYRTFFGSDTTSVAGGEATTTISDEGQSVVNLASEISTVSIDSQLFSSPLFMDLTNFDVPLTPEPQGRPNPFANIGNDAGSQTVSSTSSPSSTK